MQIVSLDHQVMNTGKGVVEGEWSGKMDAWTYMMEEGMVKKRKK